MAAGKVIFGGGASRIMASNDAAYQNYLNQRSAASTSPSSASQPNGGTSRGSGNMQTFNDLLAERRGIKEESMGVQEAQLQKLNTMKNNTMVKNSFASRNNLVSIMQQLLENSRRTTAQSARIFK